MAMGREAIVMNADSNPHPERQTVGDGWDGKLRIHGWMRDEQLSRTINLPTVHHPMIR